MNITELISAIDVTKPDLRGRSAEIFKLGDDKILKLYFPEITEENIDIELLNTSEAYRLGCTPMECFGKFTVGDRIGLVLKKLDGIPLTALPEKKPTALFTAGKIIAAQHALVHSKHTDKPRDVKDVVREALRTPAMSFLSKEEFEKADAYISALPSGDTLIHLDFHTENIMALTDGSFVTIDWMTACKGVPAAEMAMMDFLFHYAELFPGSSKLKILFMSMVRVSIYKGYIKNYVKLTGADKESSHKWNLPIYVLRLGLWDIASEREFLSTHIKNMIAKL